MHDVIALPESDSSQCSIISRKAWGIVRNLIWETR
jgi:hypothetical protein